MKVLFIGAGVISTIYGYVLSQEGNEVTHYVRPGKKQSLADGIPMGLLDGRSGKPVQQNILYKANLVESFVPADNYDVLVVSVRHYQLDSVLPLLQANAGDADILFFTGNWEGLATVDKYLQRSEYLWAYPVASGGYKDGRLDAVLLDNVILGEMSGATSPRLRRIQALFADAGLKVELQSNMLGWLWVHFAFNCGLIGAAFKAGGPDKLLNSIPRLHDGILAGTEALAVCQARGIDVKSYNDAKAFYQPAWLAATGFWLSMQANRPARKIVEMHTAIDELQRMYCDLLATGEQLKVPMPHYKALKHYVDNPPMLRGG